MGNSISECGTEAYSRRSLSRTAKKKFGLKIKLEASQHTTYFKALKTLSLTLLRRYWEEDLMHDYYFPLKLFIEKYSYAKFAPFMKKLSEVFEHYSIDSDRIPETGSTLSPSIWDRTNDEISSAIDDMRDYSITSQSKNQKFTETSEIYPTSELSLKLIKLIELESNSKDNFFFEIMEVFGELFEKKFRSSLNYFEDSLQRGPKIRARSVNSSHYTLIEYTETQICAEDEQKNKLKQEIKDQYQRAKLDLKRIQNILIDIIDGFTEQVLTAASSMEVPFSRINLESLTLSIIFRKDVCYEAYFDLIKFYVADEEILIDQALAKLKHLRPVDFNVDSKFCLEDERTPYNKVIDCLSYLDVYRNPYDKLATISEVRREILKAVSSYWKNKSNENHPRRKLEISADLLMPIYCYCLVNTSNHKMRRHQIFMEDFLNEESIQFGEKAYYFMTFIACVNYIVSINNNPLRFRLSLPDSFNSGLSANLKV